MEDEIRKLVRVLREVATDAGYAIVAEEGADDIVQHCHQRYERIYGRLSELIPAFKRYVEPLPEDASAASIRIASRDLAYYLVRGQHEPRIYEQSMESVLTSITQFLDLK